MKPARAERAPREHPHAGRSPSPKAPGVRVGTLVAASLEEGVRVTFAGQPDPLAARSTVPVAPEDRGRSVVLVFEDDDPRLPIITGLIQEGPVAPVSPANKVSVPGLTADGKTVVLEAEREVVLRCGKSTLVLRADGEIHLRGMKIVSRARGVNKVKGATVQIN